MLAAALCIGLVAFAFVAAPGACDWGWPAYLGVGTVVLLVLVALPFIVHGQRSFMLRAVLAFGLGLLGIAAWLGGLFAANLPIICRLF